MAQTGSFVNNIMQGSKDKTPVVGMGVTMLCWTDRYPFEIINVINEKTLEIRPMNAIRTDDNDMSDFQVYTYEQLPEADIVIITKRKNGKWYQRGESTGSNQFAIGFMNRYHDYSF